MLWLTARSQQRGWMSRRRSRCPLTTPCSPSRIVVSGRLGGQAPTLGALCARGWGPASWRNEDSPCPLACQCERALKRGRTGRSSVFKQTVGSRRTMQTAARGEDLINMM